MKPTDDLFRLIRSLTQSEKAYFVRRATALSGKNVAYLRLFKVVDKMSEYREDLAKKKVLPVIPVNRFAFYKNYLFSELMDALAGYHSGRTVRSRISKLYRHYELLAERGFNEKAYHLLEKALALAKEYDLPELQLEITREVLLNFPSFVRPDLTSFQNLTDKVAECGKIMEKLDKGYKIHPARIAFYFQMRKKGSHSARFDKAWLKQWEGFVREWSDVQRTEVSFEQMALLWWIRSVWFSLTGEPQKAYVASDSRRRLFCAEPHQVDEHLERYLGNLTEQISIASNLGNKPDFESLAADLEGLVESNDAIRRSEYRYLRYRMILSEVRMAGWYALREFEKFRDLYQSLLKDDIIKRALSLMEQGSATLHYQVINLIFYLASYLITAGSFREAMRVINMFPKDGKNSHPEFHLYIQFLRLIAHHELGHWDVVKRERKPLSALLSSHSAASDYERWFLEILNQSASSKSNSARRAIFQTAHAQLTTGPQSFRPAFAFFDCHEFVQSKSENISMSELMNGIK
ncbi:MAG: hypothetical protein IT233_06030 [Bacteroidia bacterium]|nr:hypothetical protein [Bacteroidia bacterium]